jgi:hypothetical protein
MTTMTENEAPPVIVDENDDRAALRAEANSLLELTKNKVKRDQTTPCPGCNILVPIKANQCPHCESNIAAHNALMRESLRRLDEIRTELDGRHDKLLKDRSDEAAKPAVRERFKRFFSGAETDDVPEVAVRATEGPRVLDTVSEGDQLKVLECDGSWLKVKTRDGRTGWVYSTFQPKP